jgi:hypothetical protein
MKVYGELEYADLHNRSSDPSAGKVGRIYWNTTSGKTMLDDGTNIYALLRNDAKAIIGNNGTAGNNVRLHRGADSLLQFVAGDDATAEGSLSAALAQISAKVENYTDSGKPSAANAGRLAWITDQSVLKIDTGSAWVPVGSAGGGGALHWVEDIDSPGPDIENSNRIYIFGSALSQFLTAAVRVPNSYVSGSQIRMRALAYSADTSGTLLLQTIATLIRTGTDAISSTTNQRTSTNSAITLSAGTNGIPQSISCDLTSSSGQINSVSVSAGDLIIVKFQRGTDTATGDAKALMYGFEVTFV